MSWEIAIRDSDLFAFSSVYTWDEGQDPYGVFDVYVHHLEARKRMLFLHSSDQGRLGLPRERVARIVEDEGVDLIVTCYPGVVADNDGAGLPIWGDWTERTALVCRDYGEYEIGPSSTL